MFLASRRPKNGSVKLPSDYTFCVKCRAPLTKKSMNQHFRKCTKRQILGQRTVLQLGRVLEGRSHEMANYHMRMTILPVLRDDDVVQAIRFDWLVMAYGNNLCMKYTAHYQQSMIRSFLRLAGRILLATKSLCKDATDLASIFQPKLYDSVIEAVRVVGRFDMITNEFKSPSTAAACVTQIRQIGDLLIGVFIRREDRENQLKTKNFIKLLNIEAGTTINRPINDARAKTKRQKIDRIPTTEDVKLLAEFVDRSIEVYFTRLSEEYSYPDFVRLCELTMVSIIVFNRRRIGETQNIVLSDFFCRESLDHQMTSKLSDVDKKAALKYSRMKVRGKLGRPVPVLIKPEIEKCIQLIIQLRKHVGVADENEFLFALPAFIKHRIRVVNGCRALRKLAKACGAKDPESLRGTTLRKQLASVCIPMELDDNAVSEVADFMGHHEKVHRDHYRKSTTFREIVYMSKLLEAAQGNDRMDDDDGDDEDEEDDDNYDSGDDEEDEFDLDMTADVPENEGVTSPLTDRDVPATTKKRNLKRKKESPKVPANETIQKSKFQIPFNFFSGFSNIPSHQLT